MMNRKEILLAGTGHGIEEKVRLCVCRAGCSCAFGKSGRADRGGTALTGKINACKSISGICMSLMAKYILFRMQGRILGVNVLNDEKRALSDTHGQTTERSMRFQDKAIFR